MLQLTIMKIFYGRFSIRSVIIQAINTLMGLITVKYIFLILTGYVLIELTLFYSMDVFKLKDVASSTNYKTIQLLTERFSYKNWLLGELGDYPFRDCTEKRCFLVKKDTFFQTPLEKSDAVLVHGQNLWVMKSRAAYKRPRDQVWIYFSMEPQHLSFCSLHYRPEDLNDWFNITITFRSDSTIVTNYKPFYDWQSLPFNHEYMHHFLNRFKEKTLIPLSSSFSPQNMRLILSRELQSKQTIDNPFIFWVVSHCDTPSKREEYVSEMLKHVDIDIYGKCGRNFPRKHHKPSECVFFDGLEKNCAVFSKYKFYLAFENSLCEEYITEKYWKLYYARNIFYFHIVPIVRGARVKQYKQHVDLSGSYINADSFRTSKDLVDYLIYLNRNQTAYEEYFKWKFDLVAQFSRLVVKFHLNSSSQISENIFNRRKIQNDKHVMCSLCSLLHNRTFLEQNSAKRWLFSEWFNPTKECWDKESKNLIYYVAKIVGLCI